MDGPFSRRARDATWPPTGMSPSTSAGLANFLYIDIYLTNLFSSELVACPRTAKHWVITPRTAKFHLGHEFDETYQNPCVLSSSTPLSTNVGQVQERHLPIQTNLRPGARILQPHDPPGAQCTRTPRHSPCDIGWRTVYRCTHPARRSVCGQPEVAA